MPLLPAVGVKVAVRVRPEPEMADRVPPARLMSLLEKVAPGSRLKVKVMEAVWPALRALAVLVMARVGARVS